MSPNQIESLSRSAGSPALPTAMTTRPQLASSPAIAVFTSGEFAIDSAIRRADFLETAPLTMTRTSLRAPSPSRAICSERSASTPESARRKFLSRPSLALEILGAPDLAAAPVANRSSVSEVDVSPSIVTALNVSSTSLFRQRRAMRAPRCGASVKTKASIVAMSGAIMPAPLAKPLMRTVALPSFALAVASFGNVSVVMIAFAASSQASGLGRGDEGVHHAVELRRIQRLADHTGRGEKNLVRACIASPARRAQR